MRRAFTLSLPLWQNRAPFGPTHADFAFGHSLSELKPKNSTGVRNKLKPQAEFFVALIRYPFAPKTKGNR